MRHDACNLKQLAKAASDATTGDRIVIFCADGTTARIRIKDGQFDYLEKQCPESDGQARYAELASLPPG